MKINVTEKNREKIEAAIDQKLGRAKSFVHDFDQALAACEEAESRLEEIGLILSERSGCSFVHKLEGPKANSYRFSAVASELRFVRGVKAWFLVDVERSQVFPREPERFALELTSEQITTGIQRLLDNLDINEVEAA